MAKSQTDKADLPLRNLPQEKFTFTVTISRTSSLLSLISDPLQPKEKTSPPKVTKISQDPEVSILPLKEEQEKEVLTEKT